MKIRQLAVMYSLAILIASISDVALALDLLRGQRIYNMHCSVCHGSNGVPVIQQAPSFVAKERLMQPDMQLVQSVRMGKTLMPPFMGILKDEEILDALYYARTLR
jgi:cytochrome c6